MVATFHVVEIWVPKAFEEFAGPGILDLAALEIAGSVLPGAPKRAAKFLVLDRFAGLGLASLVRLLPLASFHGLALRLVPVVGPAIRIQVIIVFILVIFIRLCW